MAGRMVSSLWVPPVRASATCCMGQAMRAKRTDKNHAPILNAIRDGLGWQCVSLHTQGGGVEDILVAVPGSKPFWLLLECKVPERESTGYYRYTPAQIRWRELTKGWPRITALGAEDAIAQLQLFAGDHPASCVQ